MADQDMTSAVLLDHIQAMEKRLNKRFDTVDEKLVSLKFRVNLLFTQTTNLSEGMDHMEIKVIPKLKESIRRTNKRLSDHIASPSHQPALKA